MILRAKTSVILASFAFAACSVVSAEPGPEGDEAPVVFAQGDTRRDVTSSDPNPTYALAAQATGAVVDITFLRRESPQAYLKEVAGSLHSANLVFCPGEFERQIRLGGTRGSGFLVGDGKSFSGRLVTNAHVIAAVPPRNLAVVFNFEVPEPQLSKLEIYLVDRVVYSRWNGIEDFAVLELRDLPERVGLELSTARTIDTSAALFAVGHPTGLPKKVVENGRALTDMYSDRFPFNLATYENSSGGPLVNAQGIVEGIVVSIWNPSGAAFPDYFYDSACAQGCFRSTQDISGAGMALRSYIIAPYL